MLFGCSTKSFTNAYNSTKRASYNAATDYVTWIPLAGAAFLYITPYDEKLTSYRMDHEAIEMDYDEYYRSLNAIETYITALMITDELYLDKAKRVAVEFAAFELSGYTSDALNESITKTSPSKTYDDSIGSRHAIPTFAGSVYVRQQYIY